MRAILPILPILAALAALSLPAPAHAALPGRPLARVRNAVRAFLAPPQPRRAVVAPRRAVARRGFVAVPPPVRGRAIVRGHR